MFTKRRDVHSEGNATNYLMESAALGDTNPTFAIFLVSVLALFLEMLLIRWIGTEVRIFAYLQNTILVTCFLGLGIGCFTSRKPIVLREMLLPLFILVLLFAIPITRRGLGYTSELLSVLGDLIIWNPKTLSNVPLPTILSVLFGLFLTYFLMVLIMDIFIPIGRLLGRLMDDYPQTIWAYSVNVGGSLAGTWLFVLLGSLSSPPVVWFAVVAGLLLFFIGRPSNTRNLNIGLLSGIVALSWFAGIEPKSMEVVWSPYQKLVMRETDQRKDEIGTYILNVNNFGYQVMLDLSKRNIRLNSQRYPAEMNGLSQYDMPLLLHPNPKTMLIVGAGSGNDVAAALRHGVTQITAVEIDPSILSMGRRYHPEKPYAPVTVKLINDDARSFFATCKDHYDIISFGLLDSHTTTAMTNARLDNYVYTIESLQRAKSLLAHGGIMVMSFEPQKPFIADRLARVLREVFHEDPICFRVPISSYGWGGVMFITGDLPAARQQISQNARLASLIEKWQRAYPVNLTYSTSLITDDWPYLYLRTATIPILYYILGGLMVLLLVRSQKSLQITGLIFQWSRSHWHFFFLGAAFLLLEVQNISKASVVLGNTWQVNAVIISSVLIMILLSNVLSAKFPKLPLVPVYTLLCVTCLLLYFVDLSRFAFLPYATKVVIIGSLTTLPMLFSGIVFIRSFASVVGKDAALGANLIGALAGALLQSITFVTGVKALLLIVAAFYFFSMLTRPRLKGLPALND